MNVISLKEDANIESRVRVVIIRTIGLSTEESKGQLSRGMRGWDSLGHMRLLLEIEREFGIRFPVHAVAALESVSSIVNAIEAHTSS